VLEPGVSSMKSHPGITANPVEVPTGEVKASSQGALQASAIGSCVVVAACDPKARIGGLAHVMLPGRAPQGQPQGKTRYALDAIEALVLAMTALGAEERRLEICLIGGANVLMKDDDAICETNIRSVTKVLEERGLNVLSTELGGTTRRGASMDVDKGTVSCTVGDSPRRVIWKAEMP